MSGAARRGEGAVALTAGAHMGLVAHMEHLAVTDPGGRNERMILLVEGHGEGGRTIEDHRIGEGTAALQALHAIGQNGVVGGFDEDAVRRGPRRVHAPPERRIAAATVVGFALVDVRGVHHGLSV